MDKKIIVAGAGHGGLTAAYNLAKNGYDVTVYERGAEGSLGYDWQDYFDYKAFSAAGLPIPKYGVVDKTPISFCGTDSSLPPITQAVYPGEFEMYMFRKDIYNHLLKYCTGVGVKFVYDCEITAPILLGSRIVGIKTSAGDILADLVIDAAGVDSPLRRALPEYLGIQNELNKYEYLYAYRAYYNRLEGFDDAVEDYKVHFIDDGKVGLIWLITNPDCVDILIGRFVPFGDDEIQRVYDLLKERSPYLGDKIVHGGSIAKIPVRHPMAVMVADGYAQVGDSACMTVPIVGSGISNSLKAGAMLAKAVMKDENGEYTAETLWNYQADYYKHIGAPLCVVTVIKVLLSRLTTEDIDFIIRNNILTSEDLAINSNESSLRAIFSNFTFSDIINRIKRVGGNTVLLKKIGFAAVNAGKVKLITSRFPSKYDRQAMLKWAEKYNDFFNGIIDPDKAIEED